MTEQQRATPQARVNVVGPDGKAVSVPLDKAGRALELGYKIETKEQYDGRKKEERAGGTLGEIKAAATGAASAVTLGLSDVALAKSGVMSSQELSETKEVNPTAYLGGELVGAVGQLALAKKGGPKGILGRVEDLSQLAKKGTGKALAKAGVTDASLLGRAAGKALPMATAGALEGAVYSAGRLISEDALGETELTAENLLAYTKEGALLGAGVGGAFGAGGELMKSTAKWTGKGIEKIYKRATGQDAVDGLGAAYRKAVKGYAKASSVATGAQADTIEELLTNRISRQAATGGKEVRAEAAREFKTLLDDFTNFGDKITEQATGKMKSANVQRLVKTGDEREILAQANTVLDKAKAHLDEIVAEPGLYGTNGAGRAKKALATLDANRKTIAELADKTAAGGKSNNGLVFMELDKLKRKLSPFARFGSSTSAQEIDAANKFKKVFHSLRTGLEDDKVWGEPAAGMQRNVNKAWSDYFKTEKKFKSTFLSEVNKGEFVSDPGKIETFFNQVSATRGDLKHEILKNNLTAREKLFKEISENYDLGDVAAYKDKAAANLTAMNKNLKDIEKKVIKQNQLRDLGAAGREAGEVLGGGLGYAAGGVMGGAVGGAAFGALTNPSRVVRSLAVLERMHSDVGTRVVGAVKRLGQKTSKAAGKATKAVSIGATIPAITLSTSEARREHFDKKRREVSNIMGNPAASQAAISHGLSAIHKVAPKVAAHMTLKSLTAAQFLQSKLPKNPGGPKIKALGDDFKPSDTEVSKWLRYARAVTDPVSVVEDLADGKVSREAVEAIKATAPRLYANIKIELQKHMMDLEERLPYQDRIGLSIMFETPLTDTMDPKFIAAMHPAPAQSGQGPVPGMVPKQGRAKKLDTTKPQETAMPSVAISKA